MGREVRMVPADWKHPCHDYTNRYIPLDDKPYQEARDQWIEGLKAWDPAENDGKEYWEYEGPPPLKEEHMPDWPREERTHYQMYETCSEGTPISPPMETPEKLARWLADNGASAFGSQTATYEAWLSVCKSGWAPSAACVGGRLISGVEAATMDKDDG
jgi:hypothetical protein